MEKDTGRRIDWVGLPVIATVTQLLPVLCVMMLSLWSGCLAAGSYESVNHSLENGEELKIAFDVGAGGGRLPPLLVVCQRGHDV